MYNGVYLQAVERFDPNRSLLVGIYYITPDRQVLKIGDSP